MKPDKRNIASLVYLNRQEKDKLIELAKTYNLSQSELLRFAVLNIPLPNIGKQQAISDLLKINAVLARLGNLFKLALDEDFYPEELNKHINEIADLRAILRAKIEDL